MAQEPDRLRQDIEETRASLTRDVDLLADKTSPTKAAQRRWGAVKEKVMGSSENARHAAGDSMSSAQGAVQDKASQLGDKASQLGDKAGSAAQNVAESVRSAPQTVAQRAQGNPIAAGIIAFGVGLLAATLLPVTDAERRAGQQLKDNSGELFFYKQKAANEMKDDLSGSVQQAVGEVKETAQDAAQTTRDQAQSGVQDVKSEARSAAS